MAVVTRFAITGMENAFPERSIHYLRLNIPDEAESDIDVVFDQTSDFIASSGVPTLVHCQMGCSRAPTVVIAYLMKHKGLKLSEAYNLVLERRPIIEPNPGFWRQLERYECKVFKYEYDHTMNSPLYASRTFPCRLKHSTLPLIDFLGNYIKTEFEDDFDDDLWEVTLQKLFIKR